MNDDDADDGGRGGESPGGPADNAPGPNTSREPDAEQAGASGSGDAGRGAGTSNDEPSAVGEEDDDDTAGQVREERRSKQIGDRAIDQARRSAVAQGDGPAMYVERQIVTYSGRRVFVQKQILEDRDDIDRESVTYVPVAGFDDMYDRLETNGMLVLRGAPGSGRTATAHMLLRATRRRRVGTLSVNDEDLFYILHDQLKDPPAESEPLMADGDGYVIEWTENPIARSPLTGFANAVKAAGARVVIVVDGGADLALTAAEFERTHPWPDSRPEVMAKHLDRHLRDHQECCSQELLDRHRKNILDHQAVQSRLNLAPSVLRIVEMARFLAKNLHEVAMKGIGRLVSEWDDSAWRLARQVLAGNAPPEKPHLIPQQQAFRIAYAVFHEQPLAYVFEAGDLLLAKLISFEVRKRPLKSRVFDKSVEALIDPMMIARNSANDDQPRRAQIVDESLMLSILEVAWHEYAQLRGPLREWLDDLAGRPNADVRVRAAQIVGLLATFDYSGVFGLLIKRWARSRAVYRVAAAIAMDQIARHPPLSSGVKRQIEAWTRSKLITEQDTAARWHGLRTERVAVVNAVKELSSLGSRPELRRGMSIAWAMSLLFLNGHVDEVVDELGRWIDSPNRYLPHHGVRTLLILTDPKGAGKQGRTRLSELIAGDVHREAALVRMWRRALTSRTVGAPAWNALHEWLIEADRHEDQSALMESVAVQIFTGALTRRALFYLTLWEKRRSGVQLIGRVRTQLTTSTGD